MVGKPTHCQQGSICIACFEESCIARVGAFESVGRSTIVQKVIEHYVVRDEAEANRGSHLYGRLGLHVTGRIRLGQVSANPSPHMRTMTEGFR